MSMTPGSVTVNDDETHSGTGLALDIYVALKAAYAADLPTVDTSLPAFGQNLQKAARLAILRNHAKTANAIGPAVVTHVQTHAVVSLTSVVATVGTSTSVGRAPDPLVAGDPIQGPASPVALPVTGAAGATTLGVQ